MTPPTGPLHTRGGDPLDDTMLDGLHGERCNGGKEFTTCRPVAPTEGLLAVVVVKWCGDCQAVAWEVIE